MRRALAQAGQSSVEYAVVTGALATALGIGLMDEGSVLWQWLNALAVAYQRFSFALSLPG